MGWDGVLKLKSVCSSSHLAAIVHPLLSPSIPLGICDGHEVVSGETTRRITQADDPPTHQTTANFLREVWGDILISSSSRLFKKKAL